MVVAALENFNDDTFTARASSSSCAETILAHQQIRDRVRGMLWCSIRIVYLMELTESAVCSVIRSLLQHRFFFFFFACQVKFVASCKCGLLGEQRFCCVTHSGASGLVTPVSFIISDAARTVLNDFTSFSAYLN